MLESDGKMDAVVLAGAAVAVLLCAGLAVVAFVSPVTAFTFAVSLHSPVSAQILASSFFFLIAVPPVPTLVAAAVPVATLAAVPVAAAPF